MNISSLEKESLAKYVHLGQFSTYEQKSDVADKSLELYRHYKNSSHQSPHPAACVALASIHLGYSNNQILQNIIKYDCFNLQFLYKEISKIRNRLNLSSKITFEEIQIGVKLPPRYVKLAQKIFTKIHQAFPNDETLKHPSVLCGIMLYIATDHNYDKKHMLESLSNYACISSDDILKSERFIRKTYKEDFVQTKLIEKSDQNKSESRTLKSDPIEAPFIDFPHKSLNKPGIQPKLPF
jgi:hypothetical protein